MSLYYQGVLVVENEAVIRSTFASLDSFLSLRLTGLSEKVFGIYPVACKGRSEKAQSELCRIAATLSEISGSALWFSWDSCVNNWTRLFEDGRMTSEASPFDDDVRDDIYETKTALKAVGVVDTDVKAVAEKMEGAFLWDTCGWLAENRPIG